MSSVGQRLAALRHPGRVDPPVVPRLGRHVGVRHTLVDAVGQLDPALVHREGPVEGPRRLLGPDERAGDQLVDGADQLGDGDRLALPHLVQRFVDSPLQAPGGVERRPAVTHQDQHGEECSTAPVTVRRRAGRSSRNDGAPPASTAATTATPTPGSPGRPAPSPLPTTLAPPPGARCPERSNAAQRPPEQLVCRSTPRRPPGGGAGRSADRAAAAAAVPGATSLTITTARTTRLNTRVCRTRAPPNSPSASGSTAPTTSRR